MRKSPSQVCRKYTPIFSLYPTTPKSWSCRRRKRNITIDQNFASCKTLSFLQNLRRPFIVLRAYCHTNSTSMSISTRDSADPPFDLDGSSETDCQYDHLLQRPYEKAGLHREYKKRSVTTLIRRVFHHLKWPLLFSTQSIVIFLLARALLAIKGPGPIPGRELHGLVPECQFPLCAME